MMHGGCWMNEDTDTKIFNFFLKTLLVLKTFIFYCPYKCSGSVNIEGQKGNIK